MKWIAATAFCGLIASAHALSVEPAAGLSVGHPLSPLCDLVCGGKWEPDHPAFPDEIRTTKSYRWNAETGEIVGVEHRSGGVAGINVVVTVRYVYDPATDAITAYRTGQDRTGKALPEEIAAVTIDGDGYREVRPPRDNGAVYTSTYTFPKPDTMIARLDVVTPGANPSNSSSRYVRSP